MTTETHQIAERLRQALTAVEVTRVGDTAAFRMGHTEFEAESLDKLRSKLSGTLYDTLHSGRDSRQQQRPRRIRDHAFEEKLAAATPHRYTMSTGRYAGRLDDSGEILVDLPSLRIRLAAENVDEPAHPRTGDPVRLRLPALRPALSPGFYLADGPDGRPPAGPLLRLYVHLTDPDAAADVWRECLRVLAGCRVRYRAKIASAPWLYPRMDALVVYLGHDAWSASAAIGSALTHVPGRGTTTSVLASRLAPGVSYAWEPADPRTGKSGLSFGQHRCSALTDGLLAEVTDPGMTRGAALYQALHDANIDAEAPERNLDSPHLRW
ncbi:T3SS effector HopA1 family protein [Streptomyces sp. NPDC001594]|uniref:T3SS effector HopA1 family protein n=1 Tax=Streptomyces sp. NPDC001594 TaxID=3364590 RepID=UPI00367A50DB